MLKAAPPRLDLHRLLRSLLASGEPKVQAWLRSLWKSQGAELTAEVVGKIVNGQVPRASLLQAFREDYERLVNERLYRLVNTTATEYGQRWARDMALPFDPKSERLSRAILGRVDKLPVQLATEQVAALDTIVGFYTRVAPAPAGVIAQRIRKFVGLTAREIKAVTNLEAQLVKAEASPGVIARQVEQYADLLQQARAQRIARTELTYATTQGQMEAVQQAVDEGLLKHPLLVWSAAADEVTCDICGDLDGTATQLGQSFPGGYDGPPAHPSCLLPGTLVCAPGVVAATEAFYVGPAVEIRTKGGRRISVTENHPILTAFGWKSAKLIAEGDYVLCTPDPERVAATINPNNYKGPSRIEDVFATLPVSSQMASGRMKVAAEDFHGDARFFDGDVNVEWSDAALLDYGEAACAQGGGELVLNRRGFAQPGLASSASDKLGIASLGSAHGVVGGLSKGHPLGRARARHPGVHRGGPSAGFNAGLVKPDAERGSLHIQLAREGLLGLSSLVAADEVVEVRGFRFSGHVYDLQCSPTPLYIGNSVIVHNCRCVIVVEEGWTD